MRRTSEYAVQGWSESELSAHRALLDGFVIPTFLQSVAFGDALEVCRVGYGTRHVGQAGHEAGMATPSTREALTYQAQRGDRIRNKDWMVAQDLVDPALKACLLFWADLHGGGVDALDFEPIFRLLGLAVGSHRRLWLLRELVAEGHLIEERRRTFRFKGHPDRGPLGLCPWWRCFFGMNMMVPSLFQRFRQVDGSMFAVWNVRLLRHEFQGLHEGIVSIVRGALGPISLPLAEVDQVRGQDYVYVANFCAVQPQQPEESHLDGDLPLRLSLMGPCAEGLRRLGPWPVASAILKRRFVETVAEKTGLEGGPLYRYLAEHCHIRSANTVRTYLDAPSLVGEQAEQRFNRGKIYQLALVIHYVLAGALPASLSEAALRERVTLREGGRPIDIGLWTMALRHLEAEDVVVRWDTAAARHYQLRQSALNVRAETAQVEAVAKAMMPHVSRVFTHSTRQDAGGTTAAGVWVVPRKALEVMRAQLYETIRTFMSDVMAGYNQLDDDAEQKQGLVAGDVLVCTRTMPLLL